MDISKDTLLEAFKTLTLEEAEKVMEFIKALKDKR